jgi:hypothetical protein
MGVNHMEVPEAYTDQGSNTHIVCAHDCGAEPIIHDLQCGATIDAHLLLRLMIDIFPLSFLVLEQVR